MCAWKSQHSRGDSAAALHNDWGTYRPEKRVRLADDPRRCQAWAAPGPGRARRSIIAPFSWPGHPFLM